MVHGPERGPAVFLQDFVDVDRPPAEVQARLHGDGGWLELLADTAVRHGETLVVRLRPGASGHGRGPGLRLRVRVGDPAQRGDTGVLPIRWEAARMPALFPVLDGDLEVAPLGGGQCRVVLKASYRPPFDGAGRFLDGALLHRVAQSTVRSFLHQVATGLAEGGAGSSPP